METLVTAFRGKRVLVTGHTGFKGSWLSLWLAECGATVCGYALDAPSEPNLFTAAALAQHVDDRRGDVRDYDTLRRTFQDARPEIVFHLAAQPLVRLSYAEPKTTFDTNAGGTVNVFECVRQTPSVRLIVNITSDKCYENREWHWGYREVDRLGGRDPYSCSKALAELIAASYQQTFFPTADIAAHSVDVVSARAGNVIGGGDWGADRLIPDMMRALAERRVIGIRRPQAIRPWQHVLDCLSGYLTLARHALAQPGAYTGAWNFGPTHVTQVTVAALVEKILHTWGSGAWAATDPDDGRTHEAGLLHLCSDKAAQRLGWRPRWDLDTAVRHTVTWYRDYYRDPTQALAMCRAQIRDYMDDAHE